MPEIEALLEAERRGILPEDKKPLLAEARKRGLVPGGTKRTATYSPEASSWNPATDIIKNLAPSAWETAKGTASALIHPLKTISGMADIASGGVQSGIRALTPNRNVPVSPEEQAFNVGIRDPIAEAIQNPTDIPRRVWNYTTQNPVGQLMNVSGALGVAGKATSIAALSKASDFTNPVSLLSKVPAAAANKLAATKIPEEIYARTMKMPPGSLRDTERANVLQTMVRDEKMPLGRKTTEKMTQVIADIEQRSTAAIDAATGAGAKVDMTKAITNLENLKKKYANRPNPEKYYRAIDAVKKDIIDHDFNERIQGDYLYSGVTHPSLQTSYASDMPEMAANFAEQPQAIGAPHPGGTGEGVVRIFDKNTGRYRMQNEYEIASGSRPITEVSPSQVRRADERGIPTDKMPLNLAHQLKKGIYDEIQSYYAKQQRPETSRIGIKNEIDAKAKAEVARTIRQEVLDNPEVPDTIKADMKREANLMNARKWVERAANRGGNLDVVNLSGMLFGVLVEHGLPGAIAYKVATSQQALSRIAVAMAKGGHAGWHANLPNILYQINKPAEMEEQQRPKYFGEQQGSE